MQKQTTRIPALNRAGYVIVNAEDVGTEAAAKWKSTPAVEPSAEKPLVKMTKAELLEAAETAGIKVFPEMTNKQIIAAIEAAGIEE